MSAMASSARAAYCEYGKLLRTYSRYRTASMKFLSFFSCSPRLYARSAFDASAPVTGLVMSTLSLPAHAAHRARTTARIRVLFVIAFPRQPECPGHLRGSVSLGDQRANGAPPL